MHNSLQCHFTNALLHYQILVEEVGAEVQHLAFLSLQLANVGAARPLEKDAEPNVVLRLDESTPLESHKYINAQHTTFIPKEIPLAGPSSTPLPSSSRTPSEYLWSRCPLCFGGINSISSELLTQCIMCLNANFQLKQKFDCDMRNGREGQKGFRDPQYLSPHTIILEQAFVEYWQDVTDKVHPPQGSQQ